jgi:hypothetical protein
MKLVKSILLLFIMSFLTSCFVEDGVAVIRQSIDEDSMWVFIHFNVTEKEVLEDYYYYGRISSELYDRIIDGEIQEGFIVLRDIRYWDLEDKIQKYEDYAATGTIVFKIQDIARITLQKGDPWELEQNPDEVPLQESDNA